MTYIETASDHLFTAWLATLTPSKVLRDRERTFSKTERKRQRFLREKSKVENQVAVEQMFTRQEIETAQRVVEAQSAANATHGSPCPKH
jgi:hypothetical protein